MNRVIELCSLTEADCSPVLWVQMQCRHWFPILLRIFMWIFSCNIRTYYMAEVMNKQQHLLTRQQGSNSSLPTCGSCDWAGHEIIPI